MAKELAKQYDPSEVEDRTYQFWCDKKYFHAKREKGKKTYTIVIPPPNITGQLHMGHALDNTLQDILIRYHRMAGYDTLWLPGTDHASIATEAKIVEAMRKEGITKDLRKKRLHFGLVFQDFNLFPQYDVLQNLTLAPSLLKMGTKEELEVAAKEIIKKVGLEDRINHYPCQLSGGQKQRVAIARALMLKPDILCFDEPTSALDPELTGEVLKVIKSLKTGNSTMIVVTHEMDFAKNVSDKVIFMADGVIEEYGEPKQLFENPKSDKLKAFLNNALDV
jgi:polar amino acid transport system ATP-binding protein